MRIVVSLILVLFFASSAISFSEPINLAVVKQNLVRYHDSGRYEKDIDDVTQRAMQYLAYRLTLPSHGNLKPAIVLDIDETALSNYAAIVKLDFGGTLEEIRRDEDQGVDPAIKSTLKLYQFAKKHDIHIIFLTGRYEEERAITESNLRNAGYDSWDKLILRAGEYKTKSAAIYKTAMRQQLTAEGYDIWLNMGDQQSDLVGKYSDKTFKLPNPFYLIS